jgi:hypothetical protein
MAITFDGDWCKCTCGNSPDSYGMFPCSQGGSYMEPLIETWLGYYRCGQCGAVGHPDERRDS